MTRTFPAPVVGATEPVRPTVSERLVRAGVSALGALPEPVLQWQGRRQIDVEAWQFGGRPEPVAQLQDLLTVDLQEGHVHPFSSVLGVGRTGRRAVTAIAQRLRGVLDAPTPASIPGVLS